MLLNTCERKWLLGHCTYTWQYPCLPAIAEPVIVFSCHLSLRVLSSDKAAATGATSSGAAVDIGVVRYNAKDILPANIQAKPEEGEVTQKLIPTLSDAEIEEVRYYGAIVKCQNLSFFRKETSLHRWKESLFSWWNYSQSCISFSN